MPVDNNSELIDAVYELALDPCGFDDFIELWGHYIQQHDLADSSTSTQNEVLTRHFEQTFAVMQRADAPWRTSISNIKENALACAVVATNGRVLSRNRPAEPLLKNHTQLENVLKAQDWSTFMNTLHLVHTQRASRVLVVDLQAGPICLVLVSPNLHSALLTLAFHSLDWTAEHTQRLSELYHLTPSEGEVAAQLYQGHSIKQISEQQHRSVDTIRTHTKAVLNKTNTSSQAHLMRLMGSVSMSVEQPAKLNWEQSVLGNRTLILKDGRTLSYYDTESEGHTTVVVLHGIVHDPELPPLIHQGLVDAGYRIIGVVRAWFGDSSPTTKKTDLLDNSAADLKQLLEALSLKQVHLLGIMAGALHAYTFCARNPNHVQSITNISGMVPIEDDFQLATLPVGVRAVARSARYLPRMLPSLTQAAVSLLNRGDTRRLFDIAYKNSPLDLAASRCPEIFQRLSRGYQFAVPQSHVAYTY